MLPKVENCYDRSMTANKAYFMWSSQKVHYSCIWSTVMRNSLHNLDVGICYMIIVSSLLVSEDNLLEEVLARLLTMADRADWRNCKLSKDEEIQMVDDFKQAFSEFDPAE